MTTDRRIPLSLSFTLQGLCFMALGFYNDLEILGLVISPHDVPPLSSPLQRPVFPRPPHPLILHARSLKHTLLSFLIPCLIAA
jgi:hypothetical protein